MVAMVLLSVLCIFPNIICWLSVRVQVHVVEVMEIASDNIDEVVDEAFASLRNI
jgi:hypothetical protein